jgi:hypothetical protein
MMEKMLCHELCDALRVSVVLRLVKSVTLTLLLLLYRLIICLSRALGILR